MNTPKTNLAQARFWVAFAYVVAIGLGIYAGYLSKDLHILWQFFIADSVATIVIFIFSYIFKNSSFYDPYWSVIPIVIAFFFVYYAENANQTRQILVVALVTAWGLRLTYNWLRGWTGLHHEDWRYTDLNHQTGKAYWLVSFSGIHFFPTIVVFLGLLPLYPSVMLSKAALTWVDILATLITAAAIVIEAISDNQLRYFVRTNTEKGKILATGLWKYSRHPNYFGEMLFWWGLFIFAIGIDLKYYWTGVGALAISLMFFFISIPMIDKRMLERKTNYAEHMKKVSSVMLWFSKIK